MQTLAFISHLLLFPLTKGCFDYTPTANKAQTGRSSTVQLSASTYCCLDAALPCSDKFLKFKQQFMSVTDRVGNELPAIIQSYQIRYFNVYKQVRTVQHEGRALTEQALKYFDSRESGICIYIDNVIALNPTTGATLCVNGCCLWKL